MNTSVANEIQVADLRLAFFFSLNELDKARTLFTEDKKFKGILWDDSPLLSIVMPSKAIQLLKARGLHFDVKEPIMHGLTLKQRRALKKDDAVLWESLLGVTFFLERPDLCVFEEGGNFYVEYKKS